MLWKTLSNIIISTMNLNEFSQNDYDLTRQCLHMIVEWFNNCRLHTHPLSIGTFWLRLNSSLNTEASTQYWSGLTVWLNGWNIHFQIWCFFFFVLKPKAFIPFFLLKKKLLVNSRREVIQTGMWNKSDALLISIIIFKRRLQQPLMT